MLVGKAFMLEGEGFQTVRSMQISCYFVRKSKKIIKILQFLIKKTTNVISNKQTKTLRLLG